jgi:cytochrome P450
MNALSSPESQQRFMDAFIEVQRGVRTRGALGPRMRWLHRDKSWQKACDYIHNFVDIHVDEALARVEKDEPQINGGVRLIDEMAKETRDKITLRSLAISVFSPAHDTVAVALCNVFFHLARHPHVWERLRAEIMPTADQLLSYNLLQTYKYLNCVLRESK